jgi:hypothetical protein
MRKSTPWGNTMPHSGHHHDQTPSPVGRRSFLRGGAAALGTTAGALALPGLAAAATSPAVPAGRAALLAGRRLGRAHGPVPVPPAIRSRAALTAASQAPSLPLTQGGTTFEFAQEVTWLDGEHFAVGRWDGSMSIFSFETAPFTGPLINTVVNSPSAEGVQMITRLPSRAIVTSNDDSSLGFWVSPSGQWTDLRLTAAPGYDASLGVATNGAWLAAGDPSTLVVGHDSGYVSLWSYNPATRALTFRKAVNLQNPNPVNPFGSHVIFGMAVFSSRPPGVVVAGSDDGFVSIVAVPGGAILSQTVFNPAAQRGINSVSVRGNKLLVSNCSVGPDDFNLWYFSIGSSPWGITLLDKKNLIIDTSRVQVFNFDTIWGAYSGGPCWFAATEEGVVWMGTADTSLGVIGNQSLDDRAVGAALAYQTGPGRLTAVIDDLNQFVTGAP